MSTKRSVYLGYKTTSDADDAIRDMRAVNMNGDFSYEAYEKMLEEKKTEIGSFLDFAKDEDHDFSTVEDRMLLYPILDALSPGQRAMLSYTDFRDMIVCGGLDEAAAAEDTSRSPITRPRPR